MKIRVGMRGGMVQAWLTVLCLVAFALAPARAEEVLPAGGGKRLLNGDEIFLHFKFDQWRIKGESHLGFRIDVQLQPNGEIYGSNLSGGGGITGNWEVNPREDIVCLRWERNSGLPKGCFLMSQTGPVSYQLDDPATGENVWLFVVVSAP